jgi:hypothetical protein
VPGQEPGLQFAGADDVGDQQVVAAVIALLCNPGGVVVGVDQDPLVGPTVRYQGLASCRRQVRRLVRAALRSEGTVPRASAGCRLPHKASPPGTRPQAK